MRGAHERNVLRWEARLALLDGLIARLERELARAADAAQRAQTARQLEQARRERASLGPAPRPKMG